MNNEENKHAENCPAKNVHRGSIVERFYCTCGPSPTQENTCCGCPAPNNPTDTCRGECLCHHSKSTQEGGWEKEFIEEAARLEHARWSRWQSHVHNSCDVNSFGDWILPRPLRERWQKQINQTYRELSEAEKESDRKEVREYLPLIHRLLQEREVELVEKIQKLRPEDEEAKGYEILEKEGGGCCPGDDAGTGYVAALNDILSLIQKK